MSVVFQRFGEVYIGIGTHARRWQVIPDTAGGFRLDYRDPGEPRAVYVATFATADEAMAQADRWRVAS